MEFANYEDYKQKRQQFIQETKKNVLANVDYSQKEEQANDLWLNMLQADRYQRDILYYHKYTVGHKDEYQKTNIFKTLAKMPKGSTHHIHMDCCIDNDWFVNEVAYSGNCYLNQETGFFSYFHSDDKATEGFTNLIKIKETMGAEACNKDLRERLCVTRPEAEDFSTDVWATFEKKIISFSGYFYNKNIWKNYITHVFKNFISEGVTRIEARAFMGWLKNDDESPVPSSEEMQLYYDVVAETQKYCPEFTFGIVIQGLKVWDQVELLDYYRKAFVLRKTYPDLVIAFDMVQEEDCFKTSLTLAETFIKKSELEKEYGVEFPFLFHGGESLDPQLNTNLYDLILLGSKRFGHGIQLAQHSNLVEEVKKRNICLEICPISNQVLRYHSDSRTHPLKSLLNLGVAVSISSDDPGYFGVKAVNDDFYLATISSKLDLKELKKIVHNSVFHSLCSEEQKQKQWSEVSAKWDTFIEEFLSEHQQEAHVNKLQEIIQEKAAKNFF